MTNPADNEDTREEQAELPLDAIHRILNEFINKLADTRWGSVAFDVVKGDTRHELYKLVQSQRQQAAEEATSKVFDMLGSGNDLFIEWRQYVDKQYDNPNGETRVIDSFEYWLNKKINEIRDKIKNGGGQV